MQPIIAFVFYLGLLAPVLAQDLVGDAWGLADSADTDRATWAGIRLAPSGVGSIVAPEMPHDIVLFVGQKSLVAGQDIGQAAALILDRHGNLAQDGTKVTITLDERPFPVTSKNGLAVQLVESTRAGHYHSGAATEFVQSNRAEYDVIPHLLSVVPMLASDNGLALVEAFHDFGTQPLTDQYGNLVLGGTSASFMLTAADGSITLLPGQALGGAGTARMLARDLGEEVALSGQYTVLVGNRVSVPLPYAIRPIRASAPLAIDLTAVPDLGLARMTIGPFMTNAGHYLNDGAPILAVATLGNGITLTHEAWVQDGRIVIDWLLPKAGVLISVAIDSPLGRAEQSFSPAKAGQP
ncbi:MAG: hypothetical protein U0934_11550 [Pseudotabrizicola sp.]|uniref:hypothetical protein n=1 Tax=Pseudotabrizicola sp. TaxID=2939647 RepID=UPI0027321A40|nr:hypothetical protein [Pseudotabrizicola sp.]MDP2079663.1 hypothetical protein [Pseudotabrizicola sp.]MDZ7574574.1 hypothetical protein [Pseudotabrizicola sp.]